MPPAGISQRERRPGRMPMRARASRKTSRILICLVFYGSALCIGPLACRSRSSTVEQHYELHGRVVSVDPQQRFVTIAHADIPGYMDAMTMPFTLKEPWPYRVLTAGDQVQATLVVDGKRTWLEDV